jgi:phosphotriesterase-related protein
MRQVVLAALGPIDGAQLGRTLVHEHIINVSPGIWRTWPELLGGREAFLDRATADLVQLRQEAGVDTVVDLSSADIGRDAGLLREVSARSGVNIVVCTGHHRHFTLTTSMRSVDELTEWFVRELSVGIDGTDTRAGIIKVASDRQGVQPAEERVLRAAGRAHLATAAPIYAHSCAPAGVGNRQADVLEEEGVPLSAVCIGHADDIDHYDYALALAARGCWLGMDRYPGGPSHLRDAEPRWQDRAEVVARLIADGFIDKVLLSHDHSIGLTVFEPDDVRRYHDDHPDAMLLIHRRVLPYLESRCGRDDLADRLLVDNPRRFLSGTMVT